MPSARDLGHPGHRAGSHSTRANQGGMGSTRAGKAGSWSPRRRCLPGPPTGLPARSGLTAKRPGDGTSDAHVLRDASCIPSGLSRLRFSCAPNLVPAKHSGIRAMPADGMAGRRWTQRVSRPPIFRSSPSVFASIRLKLPGPGRPSAPDPPPKSGALPHARLALPARRARCALGLRIYPLPSTLLDVHGRLRRSLGRWDRDLGLLFATSPMHESQPKLALPTHQSGVIPTSANFPGFSRAKVAPSPLAT